MRLLGALFSVSFCFVLGFALRCARGLDGTPLAEKKSDGPFASPTIAQGEQTLAFVRSGTDGVQLSGNVDGDVQSGPPSQQWPVSDHRRRNILQPLNRRPLQVAARPQPDDVECALTRGQVRRYLSAETRTWRVNATLLRDVDDDLNRLIQCTTGGDVLLFDSEFTIRPSTRVHLPWNLTISAAIETADPEDGIFPASARKQDFTCPEGDNGLFLIGRGGALLANLRFVNCSLGEGAIVRVEPCPALEDRSRLAFHHVSFVNNSLDQSSGLDTTDALCMNIELYEVDFSWNFCTGNGCGARLSSNNSLHRVQATGNRFERPVFAAVSVFFLNPGSRTVLKSFNSTENNVTSFRLENAEFTASDARFHGNFANLTEEELSTRGVSILASALFGHRDDIEAAVVSGTCISAIGSRVELTESSFEKNTGIFGGVLVLAAGCRANAVHCSFSGNEAEMAAGIAYLLYSDLSLIEVRASVNGDESARTSSFEAYNSRVSVFGSSFRGNEMTGNRIFSLQNSNATVVNSSCENIQDRRLEGAFFDVLESTVRIFDSRVKNNSVGSGGACRIRRNSELVTRNLTVENCRSAFDGGAISTSGSKVLLLDSHFYGNSAPLGGAVSLNETDSRGGIVQIVNTAFEDNRGDYGGALHLMADNFYTNCSRNSSRCTFLAMEGASFLNNAAKVGGGVLLSANLNLVLVRCATDYNLRRSDELSFYTRSELMELDSLTNRTHVCESWANNTARRYAPIVGSYATFASFAIFSYVDNVSLGVVNESFIIRNYRSGEKLPIMERELYDSYFQHPAAHVSRSSSDGVLTCSSDLRVRSIRLRFKDGHVNISDMIVNGKRGFHICAAEFPGYDAWTTTPIMIEIDGCRLGEVSTANGFSCDACSSDAYNFQENATACQTCPENADCTAHAILPKEGYWHMTPCSTHLQKCLPADACSAADRHAALHEYIRIVDSCQFNVTTAGEYNAVQCKEGYRGPLCGSCESAYGRSGSHNCRECFSCPASVAMVVFAAVVILSLAGITMRSNLKSTASATTAASLSSRRPVGPSVETEIELAEFLPQLSRSKRRVILSGSARRYSRGGVASDAAFEESNEGHCPEDQSAEAAELFKITVNFVQVLAVATGINTEWTATLSATFRAAGKIRSPSSTEGVQFAEFLGGVTSQAISHSADCLTNSSASTERSIYATIVDALLPFGVFLLFAAYWSAKTVRENLPFAVCAKRIALSANAVLYVSYISLSKRALSALTCVDVRSSLEYGEDRSERVWAEDTTIACFEGSHLTLVLAIAVPTFVLCTIGFPAVLAYVVWAYADVERMTDLVYEVAGFTYRAYKPRYAYWEAVIMMRKAALASVVVFAYPLGANLQVALAGLVLATAHFFHASFHPYDDKFRSLDKMESLSIFVSQVTFLSSIFFFDDRVSRATRTFFTLFLTVINTVTVLYLVLQLLKVSSMRLEALLDSASIETKPRNGTCGLVVAVLFRYVPLVVKEECTKLFRRIYESTDKRSNA